MIIGLNRAYIESKDERWHRHSFEIEAHIRRVYTLVDTDREYNFNERYKILRLIEGRLLEDLAELISQYVW